MRTLKVPFYASSSHCSLGHAPAMDLITTSPASGSVPRIGIDRDRGMALNPRLDVEGETAWL